jgi:phage tail tape-measure protein
MKKPMIAMLLAGSMSLGACTTYGADNDTLARAGTGAALGAAAGAGVGAVVGGLSPITGAAIGAAVGGLAGAVWADRDNDGYADGYVREGQYYQGQPTGYASGGNNCPTTLGGAAGGAAVGAAGGAGVGAIVGGINPLQGAAIGAVVGGLAGAIWADRNNDGCVDGYVREGRYYEGTPQPTYQTPAYQTPGYQTPTTVRRRGERG